MADDKEFERRIETAREITKLTGAINNSVENTKGNTVLIKKILKVLHDGNGDGLITEHKIVKKTLRDHIKSHLWWKQTVGRFVVYTGLAGLVGAILWLIQTMPH